LPYIVGWVNSNRDRSEHLRIRKQFLRFKNVYDILTKWLRSHRNALYFSLFGIPEGMLPGLML